MAGQQEAARQEGADLHVISDRQDRRRLVELIHEADLDHETNPVRIDEATKWTGVRDDRADVVPERALCPLTDTTATPSSTSTPNRCVLPLRAVSGWMWEARRHRAGMWTGWWK